MLDHGSFRPSAQGTDQGTRPEPRPPAGEAPALRVGLLNNMPDAAFVQTERQFRRLLGTDVRLDLFAFRALSRGPFAEAHIEAHYAPHEALTDAGLDALVVTGCEPRQARLEDEPFFAPLSAVIDWAALNTVSTLFSCLAAHAAVQHLHGIRRRPLPVKHSGVFTCTAASAHPLLSGLPDSVPVPHSRWNDLAEADLAAHGYRVLQRSAEVGVDLFVREQGSLFVFLQGHPEYDADSLAREYRRDVGRFLEGMSTACPQLPRHYFTAEAETLLDAFAAQAKARPEPARCAEFPGFDIAKPRPPDWQPLAMRFFRNWLACVSVRRDLGATQVAG